MSGPSPSQGKAWSLVGRYPRRVPRDSGAARLLAKRTLTNLYNAQPTWLDLAHRELDAAVSAAYGWDPGLSDEAILEALLALNLQRESTEPGAPAPEPDDEDDDA